MNKLSHFNGNVKLMEFMSHLFKVGRESVDRATTDIIAMNVQFPVYTPILRTRHPTHDFTSSFFYKQDDNNNQ